MSRRTGFLSLVAAVVGVPTTYDAAKVASLSFGSATLDNKSSKPPIDAELSHIELRFSSASSASAVDIVLSYDAAGDKVAFTPDAPVTLTAGVSTSTVKGCSASYGGQFCLWENGDAPGVGNLFLHLKMTGGTATLDSARLFWIDR